MAHTYSDEEQAQLPGLVVPQLNYLSSRPNGRESSMIFPPVKFFSVNSLGVPIRDILNGTASISNAHQVPLMPSNNPRPSIRICWPGYDAWTKEHAFTLYRSNGQAQDLQSIAYQVARTIEEFYDAMRPTPFEGTEDCSCWELRRIPFTSLYLVELRQVSQGSWQPVICYRVNFTPH